MDNTDDLFVICAGGSGSRLAAFDKPKVLYPIYKPNDTWGFPTTTPLARFLGQLQGKEVMLATGFHTNLVLEEAEKETGVVYPNLDTWDNGTRPGIMSAIVKILEADNNKHRNYYFFVGDSVWSGRDFYLFTQPHNTPIVLYHDQYEHRYGETYGMFLNHQGVQIVIDFMSQEYVLPLSPEIAINGWQRVSTQKCRIGHFERALDLTFTPEYRHKKSRKIAWRVDDFDGEREYEIVLNRSILGLYDQLQDLEVKDVNHPDNN